MDSTSEKWYSPKEFAHSFGTVPGTKDADNVSEDTVYRWINDGLLDAFEFPDRRRRGSRGRVKKLISEAERLRFIERRMSSRRRPRR
jgi:predicted DNA-binding transcriptional regulator AlpA